MADLSDLIGGAATLAFPDHLNLTEVAEFVSDWHLKETLAQSPSSSVFSAIDGAGKPCVIKAYAQPYDKAGAGAREMQRAEFEQEVSKRLPKLTPTCYAVSRYKGLIISAWDFAKGTPLSKLKADEVPQDKLIETCAYALEAVHNAGLLHLDLKPSHIFVEQEPSLRVQFIDWGLACEIEGAPPSDHDLFTTPRFASPNRLKGLPPSRGDDWFALAKSLEVLLGPLDDFTTLAKT